MKHINGFLPVFLRMICSFEVLNYSFVIQGTRFCRYHALCPGILVRFHPLAQLRRMNAEVLRRLCIRYPAIPDQLHSLKLKLACKLSFASSSIKATRCLRKGCRPLSRTVVILIIIVSCF